MPRAAHSSPAFTSFAVDAPRVVPAVRRQFSEIKSCRICGNQELAPVLSMGQQSLTGVFHKTQNAPLTSGPLELVACNTAPNLRSQRDVWPALRLPIIAESDDGQPSSGESFPVARAVSR